MTKSRREFPPSSSARRIDIIDVGSDADVALDEARRMVDAGRLQGRPKGSPTFL